MSISNLFSHVERNTPAYIAAFASGTYGRVTSYHGAFTENNNMFQLVRMELPDGTKQRVAVQMAYPPLIGDHIAGTEAGFRDFEPGSEDYRHDPDSEGFHVLREAAVVENKWTRLTNLADRFFGSRSDLSSSEPTEEIIIKPGPNRSPFLEPVVETRSPEELERVRREFEADMRATLNRDDGPASTLG